MGDRISIQFCGTKGQRPSAILFSHWRGKDLLKDAKRFIKDLNSTTIDAAYCSTPLGRREPDTVMVEFLRRYLHEEPIMTGDLYLVCSENDGDNSDNGHFAIHASTGEVMNDREPETCESCGQAILGDDE